MAIRKWKTLQRKILFTHPRITLVEDIVELPNGKTLPYLRTVPTISHSVAIIAINEKGQILLQKEYSYPPHKVMWQLPGGSIEPEEDILKAANRELSEESGYSATRCQIIGDFYTNNRLTDQKQYIVVGTGLVKKNAKKDDYEFIESFWLEEKDILQKVSNKEIDNINMLAALMLWMQSGHTI